MSLSRLETVLEDAGDLLIPPKGDIAVYGATPGLASVFPADRTHFFARHRPAFEQLKAGGLRVSPEIEGAFASAFLFVPRAKAEARDALARLVERTTGPVVVDGQKTDGIDSLIRAVRGKAEIDQVVAKAHGKLAVLTNSSFPDWIEAPRDVGGFVTRPGVFSADGIDPGSDLLANSLPDTLKGAVADLGAGWGFLGRAILGHAAVTSLDLVEADHASLDCARLNLGSDPRARFHWADATRWQPETTYDAVIMNPPFHQGRAAATDLGIGFIETARRTLRRSGSLWMVANRHLAYEKPLAERFAKVQELPGDRAYKIFRAEKPVRR